MYKKALRLKLRFNTVKGQLSTEDLWDMSLKQLNTIAKGLNREKKLATEEDFLGDVSEEDTLLALRFKIVVDIIDTKKAENKNKLELSEKKIKKARILELINKKNDEALEGLSEADLRAKLAELD